jgi:two-component system, LuxR family, sensor kinase FixL
LEQTLVQHGTKGRSVANDMRDSDKPSKKLRDLSRHALSRRVDELIAAAGEGPGADDQRALLLDLQTHQIELEMQGRELREAQQALEISRDRYARLFDLAPVGYAVLDRQTSIRDINLAAARMLRRTRSVLIDTPLSTYLAPGDMRALIAHVEKILRSEPSATPRDLKVCLRDGGESRTLELQSCRREGVDGPECFSALLDVTAREEAQRRQRESDQLRQAVLDAIPAEIVVLDCRGRIIAANQAWRRFAEGNGGSAELRDGLDIDYLAACRRILGNGAEEWNARSRTASSRCSAAGARASFRSIPAMRRGGNAGTPSRPPR